VQAALVPEHVMGVVEDVPVVLGAVLALRTGVLLYVYGLETDRTREADASFARAMETWQAALKGRRQPATRPPEHPGTRFAIELEFDLRDDRGTAYEMRGMSAGGSGTEWQATARFAPAIPTGATTLTVKLRGAVESPSPLTLGVAER
jgi:hypothetical protein